MYSSFPLKKCVDKYEIVTGNDEEHNGNKLYVEIVKGNGQK